MSALMWDDAGVWIGVAQRPDARHIPHAELAALSDYEAVMLGLPRYAEAMLVVGMEGRIDSAHARVTARFEPLASPHPWMVWRREGARMWVGERVYRLNAHQWALLEALAPFQQAGADVAARLRAWPALARALHVPPHARVMLHGQWPHVQVNASTPWPPHAMTRAAGKLQIAHAAQDGWAMLPHRRYYV